MGTLKSAPVETGDGDADGELSARPAELLLKGSDERPDAVGVEHGCRVAERGGDRQEPEAAPLGAGGSRH